MAAIAPRNSSRMQSQQGVFTISHRENISIDKVGAEGAQKNHVWRYLIPDESKNTIRNELNLLGFYPIRFFYPSDSFSRNRRCQSIEDMYSRLNEAVPLNAAEKRNTLGGIMANLIRKIADHDFFRNYVAFKNNKW